MSTETVRVSQLSKTSAVSTIVVETTRHTSRLRERSSLKTSAEQVFISCLVSTDHCPRVSPEERVTRVGRLGKCLLFYLPLISLSFFFFS